MPVGDRRSVSLEPESVAAPSPRRSLRIRPGRTDSPVPNVPQTSTSETQETVVTPQRRTRRSSSAQDVTNSSDLQKAAAEPVVGKPAGVTTRRGSRTDSESSASLPTIRRLRSGLQDMPLRRTTRLSSKDSETSENDEMKPRAGRVTRSASRSPTDITASPRRGRPRKIDKVKEEDKLPLDVIKEVEKETASPLKGEELNNNSKKRPKSKSNQEEDQTVPETTEKQVVLEEVIPKVAKVEEVIQEETVGKSTTTTPTKQLEEPANAIKTVTASESPSKSDDNQVQLQITIESITDSDSDKSTVELQLDIIELNPVSAADSTTNTIIDQVTTIVPNSPASIASETSTLTKSPEKAPGAIADDDFILRISDDDKKTSDEALSDLTLQSGSEDDDKSPERKQKYSNSVGSPRAADKTTVPAAEIRKSPIKTPVKITPCYVNLSQSPILNMKEDQPQIEEKANELNNKGELERKTEEIVEISEELMQILDEKADLQPKNVGSKLERDVNEDPEAKTVELMQINEEETDLDPRTNESALGQDITEGKSLKTVELMETSEEIVDIHPKTDESTLTDDQQVVDQDLEPKTVELKGKTEESSLPSNKQVINEDLEPESDHVTDNKEESVHTNDELDEEIQKSADLSRSIENEDNIASRDSKTDDLQDKNEESGRKSDNLEETTVEVDNKTVEQEKKEKSVDENKDILEDLDQNEQSKNETELKDKQLEETVETAGELLNDTKFDEISEKDENDETNISLIANCASPKSEISSISGPVTAKTQVTTTEIYEEINISFVCDDSKSNSPLKTSTSPTGIIEESIITEIRLKSSPIKTKSPQKSAEDNPEINASPKVSKSPVKPPTNKDSRETETPPKHSKSPAKSLGDQINCSDSEDTMEKNRDDLLAEYIAKFNTEKKRARENIDDTSESMHADKKKRKSVSDELDLKFSSDDDSDNIDPVSRKMRKTKKTRNDSDASLSSNENFIDDEAMDASDESTPSVDSNEIIDDGESIGFSSENEEYSDNDDYETGSFVTDDLDQDELLSGSEYDLDEVKIDKTAKKTRKRIIINDTDSDDNLNDTSAEQSEKSVDTSTKDEDTTSKEEIDDKLPVEEDTTNLSADKSVVDDGEKLSSPNSKKTKRLSGPETKQKYQNHLGVYLEMFDSKKEDTSPKEKKSLPSLDTEPEKAAYKIPKKKKTDESSGETAETVSTTPKYKIPKKKRESPIESKAENPEIDSNLDQTEEQLIKTNESILSDEESLTLEDKIELELQKLKDEPVERTSKHPDIQFERTSPETRRPKTSVVELSLLSEELIIKPVMSQKIDSEPEGIEPTGPERTEKPNEDLEVDEMLEDFHDTVPGAPQIDETKQVTSPKRPVLMEKQLNAENATEESVKSPFDSKPNRKSKRLSNKTEDLSNISTVDLEETLEETSVEVEPKKSRKSKRLSNKTEDLSPTEVISGQFVKSPGKPDAFEEVETLEEEIVVVEPKRNKKSKRLSNKTEDLSNTEVISGQFVKSPGKPDTSETVEIVEDLEEDIVNVKSKKNRKSKRSSIKTEDLLNISGLFVKSPAKPDFNETVAIEESSEEDILIMEPKKSKKSKRLSNKTEDLSNISGQFVKSPAKPEIFETVETLDEVNLVVASKKNKKSRRSTEKTEDLANISGQFVKSPKHVDIPKIFNVVDVSEQEDIMVKAKKTKKSKHLPVQIEETASGLFVKSPKKQEMEEIPELVPIEMKKRKKSPTKHTEIVSQSKKLKHSEHLSSKRVKTLSKSSSNDDDEPPQLVPIQTTAGIFDIVENNAESNRKIKQKRKTPPKAQDTSLVMLAFDDDRRKLTSQKKKIQKQKENQELPVPKMKKQNTTTSNTDYCTQSNNYTADFLVTNEISAPSKSEMSIPAKKSNIYKNLIRASGSGTTRNNLIKVETLSAASCTIKKQKKYKKYTKGIDQQIKASLTGSTKGVNFKEEYLFGGTIKRVPVADLLKHQRKN